MKQFFQRILQELWKNNNTWNIRCLVAELFFPSAQRIILKIVVFLVWMDAQPKNQILNWLVWVSRDLSPLKNGQAFLVFEKYFNIEKYVCKVGKSKQKSAKNCFVQKKNWIRFGRPTYFFYSLHLNWKVDLHLQTLKRKSWSLMQHLFFVKIIWFETLMTGIYMYVI